MLPRYEISLKQVLGGCQALGSPLNAVVEEAVKLGCVLRSVQPRVASFSTPLGSPGELVAYPGQVDVSEQSAQPGGALSYGFISLSVNEDKAKIGNSAHYGRLFCRGHWHDIESLDYCRMVIFEGELADSFCRYRRGVGDKRVLVENLVDGSLAKIVNPCNSSRYFAGGRSGIKARIRHRLGRWYNCPGLLLSLTFSPDLISRSDAWRECRVRGRDFVNRVNRWRKRQGMPRAKFLSVIELQPGTGYPHLHLVFPYLRYLAPVAFMTASWGQADNSVDYKVKDSFSPVAYVCKYVSKLEGWSDVALAYVWANRTRLYSMSRDYSLPDYSDKRVAEWVFKRCMSTRRAMEFLVSGLGGYETVQGGEDLVKVILKRGSDGL